MNGTGKKPLGYKGTGEKKKGVKKSCCPRISRSGTGEGKEEWVRVFVVRRNGRKREWEKWKRGGVLREREKGQEIVRKRNR